ncbi:MAG: RHS repeat-associated core domain-containing protein, partial [Myxococcales bacterium]|nr:RHS repeat-associated core domain-containing protein [Myxococcales bacterium]
VGGAIQYNQRGLPLQLQATIGSTRYNIVAQQTYTEDGLPYDRSVGEDGALLTRHSYDARRRPTQVTTTRAPTFSETGERPLSDVSVVHDMRYGWDDANNLVSVMDNRTASQWPAGARPTNYDITHDSLYRVTGVDFSYLDDVSGWGPLDSASDWRDEEARHRAADPTRRRAAPMLPNLPLDANRVVSLAYEYDWLGNMVEWSDDAGSFYERSLGPGGQIGNGFDDPADAAAAPSEGRRPAALYLSSNIRTSSGLPLSPGNGWLSLEYGEGGNVETMTVRAECTDAGAAGSCVDDPTLSYDAREASLLAGCACAREQHYQYRWDELDRIAEARRYWRRGGAGTWQLAVRQRYRYDAGNGRMVKQTLSGDTEDLDAGEEPPAPEAISLYVYPGDFERRGLVTDAIAGEYDASAALGTESQYLVAGARIVWRPGTPAAGFDRDHRITYAVGDLLGSTSSVVAFRFDDYSKIELIEHTTFYPNGARESYRTTTLDEYQLEPVGFTGKESDDEVGLAYFGHRYLIPRIGRWASPDPLQVHAGSGGEFGNSYHYVSGNLLQARDPDGLGDPDITDAAEATDQAAQGQAEQDAEHARQYSTSTFEVDVAAPTGWTSMAGRYARGREGDGEWEYYMWVERASNPQAGEAGGGYWRRVHADSASPDLSGNAVIGCIGPGIITGLLRAGGRLIVGRAASSGASAIDDIAGAADELAGAADELAGAADELAGAADEAVTASGGQGAAAGAGGSASGG